MIGPGSAARSAQAGTEAIRRGESPLVNPSVRVCEETAAREKPANDTRRAVSEMARTGQLDIVNATRYRPSATGPSVAPTTALSVFIVASTNRLAPASGAPYRTSSR